MIKQIDHILKSRDKKITDDETVRQALPHAAFRFANSFIVIHHMGPAVIQPGQVSRIHPHPHRGFAPYTFMLQGEGYHRDSAGHEGKVQAGGVQWMFAGKGLLHSEGPTAELLRNGGVTEAIQLWINVPQARKCDEPAYQSATAAQMPQVLKQDGVYFKLASGEFDGQKGPVEQYSPVVSAVGSVSAGKTITIKATPGYWTLLYVISGQVTVNDTEVTEAHLVVFNKDGDDITIQAHEDTRLLYLSAQPIDEPLAVKGNFVMNTPQEIEQAYADYENGLFGRLDD